MNNENIKNKIDELSEQTSMNMGVAFGKKKKNGKTLDQLSFIYLVEKKKPLSELKDDEIVPNFIEVDGNKFPTDVIEIGKVVSLACPSNVTNNCYGWQTSTPANNDYQRPLKGGLGITSSNWAGYVGTLGVICKDTATDALVGLTNNHVVIKDAFYTAYRTPFGTLDNEIIDKVYQPAYDVNNPSSEIGRVIRYEPIYPVFAADNYIDVAVVSLKSSDIDITQSYKQFGLTGFNSYMEFATTSEIDNLVSTSPPLISSGRSTGVKEGSPCGLQITAIGTIGSIVYNLQGNEIPAYWKDGIVFERNPNEECLYPIARGDSGSALIANLSGTYKIVGLVYAGSDTGQYGIACRIDRIASTMGVKAWTGGTVNYINPDSIQIVTGDRASLNRNIVCSGKTFWQVGLTTYNNPCV